jgi:hypothetical protein
VAGRSQRLQLEFQVGNGLGVDQLAKLLGAEQLGEELAIERQRLGAALGQRGVALVDVAGDVVEEQGGGEG